MNETSYRLSQLEAMNSRLKSNENMYKMILNTSRNALLYHCFPENRMVHLGNWSHFFGSDCSGNTDLHSILDYIEEDERIRVYDCMVLEKTKKE